MAIMEKDLKREIVNHQLQNKTRTWWLKPSLQACFHFDFEFSVLYPKQISFWIDEFNG